MRSRSLLTAFSLVLFVFGSGSRADTVTEWNEAALSAIRARNTAPPAAARNLAILHASIFDAVNGMARTHNQYKVALSTTGGNKQAAAAAAAFTALSALYPELRSEFEVLYLAELNMIPDGPERSAGIAWGLFVAEQILSLRTGDGSAATVRYRPGRAPGQWRPTISFGGIIRPALLPQWGGVTPFGISGPADYLPPPPPDIRSQQYAAEVRMVQDFGSTTSTQRTTDQTEIALFWGYGPGSSTPAGHWNQIAQAVSVSEGLSLEQNARLFALINIALADAAIVSWECKFRDNLWRPITAIREADTDGNPSTAPDPGWTPLLPTPPFPEYTSGHSTFSGAAAAVLGNFFGRDDIPFIVGSDDLSGITRSYPGFSVAAVESGLSRIYGGIHFMSANLHGIDTGSRVGRDVSLTLLRPIPDR